MEDVFDQLTNAKLRGMDVDYMKTLPQIYPSTYQSSDRVGLGILLLSNKC